MINQYIDELSADLAALSDHIWDYAEVRFEEKQSSEAIAAFLKSHEFQVEFYQEDLPTAFKATYGQGTPVIGLLGEYDALPDMSQYADTVEKKAVEEGEPGHGCGHNLLGVGAAGAAVAVKEMMAAKNFSGTIIYFGCPAEEGGGGKGMMAKLGAFDDLDVALTWHPFHRSFVLHSTSLATTELQVTFHGVSAHAALEPHKGRSALDGIELMNIGINYLREHIRDEERVHYSILDAGGKATTVIPSRATALYKMRALTKHRLEEVKRRVVDIAQGASLMTGTNYEVVEKGSALDILPNLHLAKLLYQSAVKYPVADLTEGEEQYAQQIILTFIDPKSRPTVLATEFDEFTGAEGHLAGSTDVGDVSHLLPVGQVFVATAAADTPLHSWQMVAQGKMSYAHKGMLRAAMILADTCKMILEQPELLKPIKEEWKQRSSS